ncbi:hypothetical protein Gasu2_22570 [Galdieria sulphuraria]|uniref:Uncharacterized protein n=1 Tax=Galdieria sulphuraria TaxID=130081 RepID=M2X7C1_GALSU|nr:uncharacterized protein Gasu_66140 [Galdieria sulphuraria]EME25727.1 hypothetical protein Gasu_66140 [Galdieria sulphuraria]GJD07934.1 hypothetical protein Gasu2_22570 [Galdieria sulphuraria]|eukprot:XP_005702247.1 hypothetical protein Gasu_66140 [Galdieria sulphuraria]
MEDKPSQLSSVQKHLFKVFPYWSPDKYETFRKEKIGPGSNSFCGSLFRFVREPKKRRKESPFGGLVVIGEWDVWDFSKTEVEDSDRVLEELLSSPTFERLTCYSWKQNFDISGNSNCNVFKSAGKETSETLNVDSFCEANMADEDIEMLEAVERFIKSSADFGNLLSPIIWVGTISEQNGFRETETLDQLHVSENLSSLLESGEKEEGEI